MVEQHDEWDAAERRYLAAASMLASTVTTATADNIITIPEIVAA